MYFLLFFKWFILKNKKPEVSVGYVTSCHLPPNNSSNLSCFSDFKFASPTCCGLLSFSSLTLSALRCLSGKKCTELKWYFSAASKELKKKTGFLIYAVPVARLDFRVIQLLWQTAWNRPCICLCANEEYSNFKMQYIFTGTLIVLMFKHLIMQS